MEIVSSNSFATNFPSVQENEILRDNIIETFVESLKTLDIIFLTGPDEIGKTTFLGQFARKYSNNVLSCFLKPVNDFGMNLENILYDFLTQINFLITKETDIDLNPNTELFSRYLIKLARIKRNQTFYFLLDGFESIESKNVFQLMPLFEMLPFGYANFKFIVSETNDKVKHAFFSSIKMSALKMFPYPFPKFSFDEVTKYLNDQNLDKHQIAEICKITEYLPGRLKIIKDSKKDNHINYDEILQAKTFSELLDKQWNAIQNIDEDLILFLAVLAHEQNNTIDFITRLLSISEVTLTNYVNQAPFLIIEKDTVNFNSSTFRNYTKRRL